MQARLLPVLSSAPHPPFWLQKPPCLLHIPRGPHSASQVRPHTVLSHSSILSALMQAYSSLWQSGSSRHKSAVRHLQAVFSHLQFLPPHPQAPFLPSPVLLPDPFWPYQAPLWLHLPVHACAGSPALRTAPSPVPSLHRSDPHILLCMQSAPLLRPPAYSIPYTPQA